MITSRIAQMGYRLFSVFYMFEAIDDMQFFERAPYGHCVYLIVFDEKDRFASCFHCCSTTPVGIEVIVLGRVKKNVLPWPGDDSTPT